MNINDVLDNIASGQLSPEEALQLISGSGFNDMSFAKVDLGRHKRCGFPEIIFCAGKTDQQIALIAKTLRDAGQPMLATKATVSNYESVKQIVPEAVYHETAKIICAGEPDKRLQGNVAIISAGTSDIPIAEEASVTCSFFGLEVMQIFDVGAAGIHRIEPALKILKENDIAIVVAGMDGVLPTIISGLTDLPVIAVPTSIGYGASFDGLAALLTMLNSCAPGLAVVNIDNGFGAAFMACKILKKTLNK